MATAAAEDGGDKRPSTPYDYHRLDSLRSQESVNVSLPPKTTVPVTADRPPATSSAPEPGPEPLQAAATATVTATATAPVPGSPSTPSTPPNRPVPVSQLYPEDQVKRDSGIDDSTPNDACSPIGQSPLRGVHHETLRSPSLPSIVVQDAPPRSSRSNRGFLRKFSREGDRNFLREEEPPVSNHQRLRSFHGIEMDLPADSGLDDLNQPEKLKFSNRGSVLLNGKKLDALFEARVKEDGTEESAPDTPQSPQATANTPAKGTGLKTGRRTPSVHMLQAVMQGNRVLSAEEITFSQRVRTMYEYGDEKAADWTAGSTALDMPLPPMPEVSFSREETPEPEAADMVLDNPRRRPLPDERVRTANTESRMSFISREPHEMAGGIEDWDDVPQGAVDRYGFINPTRIMSHDPSVNGSLPPPESRIGLQRVTTSLQLLSSNPRQARRGLFRGPSSNRHSRSMPPPRAPSRQTSRTVGTFGPSPSIYSFQSSRSNVRVGNPFRGRDRRALDEAPDMLTLPPYLANIAETDTPSSATYSDVIKRREWSREEKWRKMARVVRSSTSKGGGMKFDFDTSDPKLVARTWKGIPDCWRATAWHAFLSTSARKRGDFPSDETLVRLFVEYQEQSSADDVQIDVDVPRTISMHIMFRRRYRGGQRLLFRVLHAISIHFPSTGYVQGMAALAATLLCYFDEEMAFVMLVRMWQLRGLEELYRSGFDGLMAALDEFQTKWLANDTEVAEKLVDVGVDPTSYGTRWYLTLFNMSIPFPAQLRIWDVFMLLGDAAPSPSMPPTTATKHFDPTADSALSTVGGSSQQQGKFGGADLSVLHAASSAMVEAMRGVLLESDFEDAMKMLTSWIPVQDEDMLMRVARAEWKIGMRNRRREGRIMS